MKRGFIYVERKRERERVRGRVRESTRERTCFYLILTAVNKERDDDSQTTCENVSNH